MSNSELNRFVSDIQANADLKAKLAAMPGATAEERLTAMRAAGYDITQGDVASGKGALADSQLDDVAGGGLHLGRIFHTIVNQIWN